MRTCTSRVGMATVERTTAAVSDLSWESVRHTLLVVLFVLYPFHRVTELVVPAIDVGFSTNLSYGDPVVALAIGLWLLGVLGPRRLPEYSRLVAALALVALGSVLVNAMDPTAYFSVRTGLVAYVKLLGSIAWFVAVFALVAKRPSTFVPTAAAVSVPVAMLFTLAALYDVVVAAEVARQTGPFENPNLFGHYLVFNACLALYLRETWVSARWPWTRGLALGAVAILSSAILVTGSRGTLLAAGLVAVFVVARSVTIGRRRGAAAAAVAALATAATVLVVHRTVPFLTERFLSAKNLRGRIELWTTAIEAFTTSPVLGIGYGQYQQYFAAHGGKQIGAHSTYLMAAAETGVIGLAALLLLLGAVVWDGDVVSRTRPELRYLVAFVVGAAGQGLVTDVDNFRAVWIAIAFLAAYSLATPREQTGLRRLGERAATLLSIR